VIAALGATKQAHQCMLAWLLFSLIKIPGSSDGPGRLDISMVEMSKGIYFATSECFLGRDFLIFIRTYDAYGCLPW